MLAHSQPLVTGLAPRGLRDAFNQQKRISLAITHDRRSLEERYPKISRLAVLLPTGEDHPNFGYIDANLSDLLFGQSIKMLNQSFGAAGALYDQGGPRAIQLSLKLVF